MVDVVVGCLLVGKLDVEADGETACLLCAFVGGFHDAGTASGDDGKAFAGKGGSDGFGEMVVVRAGLDAGGAEDGDGGSGTAHGFEAVDEFGHDFEDAPAV